MTSILENKSFLMENMMGPNSAVILNELLSKFSLPHQGNILDLGCGKGLTSIVLAQQTNAKIFALDLWIDAMENQKDLKLSTWKIIYSLYKPIYYTARLNKTFSIQLSASTVTIISGTKKIF